MFNTLASFIAPIRFSAPTHVLQGQVADGARADAGRAGWFESSWELMNGLDVAECDAESCGFDFAQ